MGKFCQFLTVTCPPHDSGGVLLFYIFINDVSWQYCENFRKFEQVELVENPPLIYLLCQYLHNNHFYYGKKMKIFWQYCENFGAQLFKANDVVS